MTARVIFNRKGGVGKSSITVNLAAIEASRGKRTLVIDLDPQCNATQYLLGHDSVAGGNEVTPNIGGYFAQQLKARASSLEANDFVHSTAFDNLFILPSNPELGEIEYLLESKHKIYKFRSLIGKLSREYDEIYVDTPPAFNFYTLSALIAADSCIIPFDCDAFSRQALYNLLENVEETREDHNENLVVEGILVNQFLPRAKLPQQLIDALIEEGLPVLATKLGSSVIMRESHQECKPLINLAPKHKLTADFIAVFDELHKV